MAVPRWLWKMLGGATDAAGNPSADPTDRIEVFEGFPDDAKAIVGALTDAGLHPSDDTYCPAIWPYNTEDPRGRVFVPAAEVGSAEEIVGQLPHLGNRMGSAGPAVFPGFVGPRPLDGAAGATGAEAALGPGGVHEKLSRPAKHRG